MKHHGTEMSRDDRDYVCCYFLSSQRRQKAHTFESHVFRNAVRMACESTTQQKIIMLSRMYFLFIDKCNQILR